MEDSGIVAGEIDKHIEYPSVLHILRSFVLDSVAPSPIADTIAREHLRVVLSTRLFRHLYKTIRLGTL